MHTTTKPTFWQRSGVHNWFLKKEAGVTETSSMTPDLVYKYIIEKFKESVTELSFADRVIFYHEYIICFSPPDYNKFMDNNRGIFSLIIKESVKAFYTILQEHRQKGKKVTASANKWVFRFVSHPDYEKGDKSFIGKLLPGNNVQQKEENLRVTFIPRQTGIAQTFDIADEILKDFTFYSDGYYEIPWNEGLVLGDVNDPKVPRYLARLEATLPDKKFAGKKLEYLIKDDIITVAGIDEKKEQQGVFRIPSEWVSSPHLSIRFDKAADKFFVASFGEKTIVNENEVGNSTSDVPIWTELPMNSRIVLNGIVSINIFKV
ncbi:MAG: hypothetical protein JWR61_4362 [Ferruginibacter sp.]|uniref:hypothetical protein n=1 Tax=Ferruginibacter sp. TaxID=1940288 RepID=UPI00265A72FE|nr:hypothetical protein [Ferruginibacter sp.]MDB5279407.1 hypothetical protein [Ferruginibacter sp.]